MVNFSMQIHPVVSRLCASIQGTSPARLADCLGLDSSKVISISSPGSSGIQSPIIFLCSYFSYMGANNVNLGLSVPKQTK